MDTSLKLDLEAAERRQSTTLPQLTVAELYVLRSRGYLPGQALSTTEIGLLLGLTHQAVSMAEQRALGKLAQLPEVRAALALLDDEPEEAPAAGQRVA